MNIYLKSKINEGIETMLQILVKYSLRSYLLSFYIDRVYNYVTLKKDIMGLFILLDDIPYIFNVALIATNNKKYGQTFRHCRKNQITR